MQDASILIIVRIFHLEDFGLEIHLQSHPSVDIYALLSPPRHLIPPQLSGRRRQKDQKERKSGYHVTSHYVL